MNNPNQQRMDVLTESWAPLLDNDKFPEIKDSYRKGVTAVLLENQKQFLKEAAAASNQTGQVDNWDPILISLVRRSAPNLIAYDICGVQPMTGPTGLIFSMRSQYVTDVDADTRLEALFNEADTDFSGAGTHQGTDATDGTTYGVGSGMGTSAGERLGSTVGVNDFASMGFEIDRVPVTARTRALKAEFTMELQQDLKAIHGLDAETELANILSNEILAEINREVVRKIYLSAQTGAQQNVATPGTFDLDVDSNGRWSVERFKGLLFQIERDCNQIAKDTRRGRGNILITSSDVASAMSMAGVLDHTPALQSNLEVDDTGNTFAGLLHGKIRVFVDPYHTPTNGLEFYCAGYRGANPMDAGIYYCPYVPLQMVRAVGENTFQPKIAFKTRYGLVQNPFVPNTPPAIGDTFPGNVGDGASAGEKVNQYYKFVKVKNLA